MTIYPRLGKSLQFVLDCMEERYLNNPHDMCMDWPNVRESPPLNSHTHTHTHGTGRPGNRP